MTNSDNAKCITSEALKRGREKIRAMRDMGVVFKQQNPIEKAIAKPNSMKLAINAKCWDCIGRGHDPKPKLLIKWCPIGKNCSLYNFRPYQKIKGDNPWLER